MSFIKKIEQEYPDFYLLHLEDGRVIGITSDCIVLYKNADDVFESDGDYRPMISLIKEATNYEKAVEIYKAKGQSAVFDAVLDGTLTATSWDWCVPCECESPHEGLTCLVCGTENEKENLEIDLDGGLSAINE